MDNTSYTERLKTIIIVVLFISTVLLSYFYWHTPSISGIKQSVNEHFSSSIFTSEDVPDLTSFVYPKELRVNFGDSTYTMLQNDSAKLWDSFLEAYISFTNMPNLIIEEISEKQWVETMSLKSIQFVFDYNLPATFFESIGAGNFGQLEYFNSLSTAAISEASPTSLFIKDDSQGKYFRIISDSKFYPLDEELAKINNTYENQYYPIYIFLGTENYAMAPYKTDLLLPVLVSEKKLVQRHENYEKELAKAFFGESLDFIRKITDDNGTIIYMYGYGNKMLTISKNGVYEYQESPSTEDIYINFDKALSTAVSFIANHGSWKSYDGEELNAQLKSVSLSTKGKRSVYNFQFITKYNNYPMYGSQASKIEIEVSGNKVTYYSRNMSMLNPDELATYFPEDRTNYQITDILSNNYQSIATTLINRGILAPDNASMDLFDLVISNISSIKSGYYSTVNEENIEYIPSWIIDFSGFMIFFNLYTGEYLGYFNEMGQ